MLMVRRLFSSFCRTGLFHAVKHIARRLLPEERYYRLKDRILERVLKGYNNAVHMPTAFFGVEGQVGVNVAGYLSSGLGLGESARNMASVIASQNIPFVENDFELRGVRKVHTELEANMSNDNPYCINLVNVNPDCWIFYRTQSARGYFDNRYNIGIWYWEAHSLPREWTYCFRFFHEIWAATDFIHDAFSAHSPVPVVKIPPVVRVDPAPLTPRRNFNIPEDVYLFLFVFDFNSTAARKNPLAVIRAFKDAFAGEADAMLCLKASGGKQFGNEIRDLYAVMDDADNIMVIDDYLEREKLNSLMNACDCYVSLHRSEGFGASIAEAMLLEKPVIVTGYSGNMDYTNESNSLLVSYSLTEFDHNTGPYRKGTVWAEPDTAHASTLMRWAYEHRDEARKLGKRGAETVRGLYNISAVGETVRRRLYSIAGEPVGG